MRPNYKTVYKPGHPLADKQGRVATHRFVWFEANGVIPNGFHVHHKNGDMFDNRVENLEILSASSHSRHHVKPKPRVVLNCAQCGKVIERSPDIARQRNKESKTIYRFCGNSCSASFFNKHRARAGAL